MPSREALFTAFAALTSGGCKMPGEISADVGLSVSGYEVTLGDLSDDDLSVAVVLYLRKPREGYPTWPTAGHLLAMLPKPLTLTADEAWGHALALAKHPRPEVLHDDPAINTAIENAVHAVGGWERLEALPDLDWAPERSIELTAVAASFRRAYCGHSERVVAALDVETSRGLLAGVEERRAIEGGQ